MASKKYLSNGTRIQYTITRKIIPGKKLYYSCSKAEEAIYDAWIAKLEAMLDAGVIPPEIKEKFDRKAPRAWRYRYIRLVASQLSKGRGGSEHQRR